MGRVCILAAFTPLECYRSVPLTCPSFCTLHSAQNGEWAYLKLVMTIRPLEKYCYIYDTPVQSYKSTNNHQYCSWSCCVISLYTTDISWYFLQKGSLVPMPFWEGETAWQLQRQFKLLLPLPESWKSQSDFSSLSHDNSKPNCVMR